MARSLDAATATALVADIVYSMWLIRLDIDTDPVYIHTGFGNLTFGGGYDTKLQGVTFVGVGNIGEIGVISDDSGGSQAVTLKLPGVDLADDYLHQIISSGDKWQRRNAYLFMATLDASGAILGKPFRVKTGRIDKMEITIDPGASTGELTVTLESQQAYMSQALNTRWIEQNQIDSTDTSQNYVLSLANKVPSIGGNSSAAAGSDYSVSEPQLNMNFI